MKTMTQSSPGVFLLLAVLLLAPAVEAERSGPPAPTSEAVFNEATQAVHSDTGDSPPEALDTFFDEILIDAPLMPLVGPERDLGRALFHRAGAGQRTQPNAVAPDPGAPGQGLTWTDRLGTPVRAGS